MFIHCLLASVMVQSAPAIQVRPGPRAGDVEVVASVGRKLAATLPIGTVSPKRGEALLRVSLLTTSKDPGPAIFGSYHHANGTLRFVPRFRLVPGQAYRITYRPPKGAGVEQNYRVPLRYTKAAPRVTAIYPTVTQLPANQLKFYIHFSQPMREGRDIFRHIQLLDNNGKTVLGAWRRTELWNKDATRFTLWIHPGRIKQGVNLRDEEGPVLVTGKKYTLRISTDLQGADGQPLVREHLKSFEAAATDHRRPNPSRWIVAPPRYATRDPLRVNFREPLDHALSLRCLRVHDAKGNPVPGTATLAQGESHWNFVPSSPWQDVPHHLSVSGTLEDLAGNTPVRAFDTDLDASKPSPQAKRISFRPGP